MAENAHVCHLFNHLIYDLREEALVPCDNSGALCCAS